MAGTGSQTRSKKTMSTASEEAAELVRLGYCQVSRKFRSVARLPEGKTGIEALADASRDLVWARTLGEEHAAEQFRRVYAIYAPAEQRLILILTREVFDAFKRQCRG